MELRPQALHGLLTTFTHRRGPCLEDPEPSIWPLSSEAARTRRSLCGTHLLRPLPFVPCGTGRELQARGARRLPWVAESPAGQAQDAT